MNDRNKSTVANDWVLKLANGINPLDGSIIPDGDIVNNVHISRCLFYVSELLGTLPQKGNKKSKEYENEFFIKPEDLEKVTIVERTGIANFVREINKLISDNTRPVSYGYLIVKEGKLEPFLGCTNYKSDKTGCGGFMTKDYYLKHICK